MKSPLTVEFTLVSTQGRESQSGPVVGRTRDVSRDGLCLETNTVMIGRTHILGEAMEGDRRLLMVITVPDEENSLEALGEVIWYGLAPRDSDFRFRAGVLFTEIGEEGRKRWQDFLTSVRKKKIF